MRAATKPKRKKSANGQTKERERTHLTEGQQSEEALRASERLNRSLVDSSIDCIKTLDLDGNLLSMSDGGQRLLEISDINRYLNRCWIDFWKEEDRPPVREAVNAARNGGTGRFQAFCPSEKGSPRWWDVIVTPILGPDSKPERLLSVSREISQQKQAEAALIESEQRYRQLFESMLNGVAHCRMIYDEQKRPYDYLYLYTNPAFDRLTDRHDSAGKSYRELFPGGHELNPELLETYARVVATGNAEQFEICFKALNYWYSVTAYRTGPDEFVHIFENITERKRAETALRESEERFRIAQELSPDGFLIFRPIRDNTGTLTDFLWMYENAAAARMNETDPKEVCGKRVSEVLPHHDQSPFGKAYKEVAETGEVRVLEEALYDQDTFHQRRWFRVAAVPTAGGDVAVLVQNVTERKQAEEALRESEAQFRHLANAMPQLCWMANADGWIFWYNDGWYKYTGTTPQQMEGWGWQSVHNPETLPAVLERWKASIASGESFDMVFPLKGTDGVFRPFLTRVVPIKDSGGKVVRWFGTNTDVTDLRKAQEAAQQLAAIVQSAEEAIVGKTLDGAITSWNLGAQQLYGYTADEAIGRHISMLLPTGQTNEVPHLLEDLRKGKAVPPYETLRQTKDGRVVAVLLKISPIRDASGELVGASSFAHDITDRKQAEEALRASEERWSTTLQSIGDAVISTCAQGKVIFMNEVAQKLTGWTLADAEGKPLSAVFNIVQEVTRIKPEDPVSKVIRLGEVVGLANHTVLIRRDGKEVPIEDSGAPIRNREGKIEGVVLVFHDVTEQRKMEKALRNSERLATTGRLAATIAHEIHNPLDVVGNVLFLTGQSTKEEERRKYLAMAAEELERVTQMTQQMLTFQRESATPVPVKIKDILENVIGLYQKKIKTAGVRIETEIDFDEPILAQPGELRQVFANLLGNALEAASGDHKRIRLRARDARDWRNGGRGLRVLVGDTGRGIPAEIRQQIFEPFFTTKGESGTGLGLWITTGILSKYDAVLRVKSSTRDGRSGTCFSVFFPSVPPELHRQGGA